MGDLKHEVGMTRWPRSVKEVDIVLNNYFVRQNNEEIVRLSLPAMEPLPKRARMTHVNETEESQVCTDFRELFLSISIESKAFKLVPGVY